MRACGADPHSPDKLNYELIQLNFLECDGESHTAIEEIIVSFNVTRQNPYQVRSQCLRI